MGDRFESLDMNRRAFLAGVGTVGVGAVSAGIGYIALSDDDPEPYELRVFPGKRNWTETRCVLDPETVRAHPRLADALESAADISLGEEVSRGLAPNQASEIRYALENCDPATTGNGLYRYEGEWFLIGIVIVDPDRINSHHGHNHSHPTMSDP